MENTKDFPKAKTGQKRPDDDEGARYAILRSKKVNLHDFERAGLRSRVDPSKGKRKKNISSGTESTQGSAISQRQVPEMPIISEPEFELTMSNFTRYKSPSEGSRRHLHEPVQTVLHSVQGQGLRKVSTNPPRSDEVLAHPQKVPQRGGNNEILQWM
ncbi:hypothetical protein O181_036880 [Austropuccinia psidii MF-1]|uniref:Uncharacterized protein n=1 Tax=Austropuccinia psidii MF-1 TaxID=1389203 RepID=A0A9Q3D9S5_9BASI|nr:hypothetical protein [Austropuccinia psidii MF-1]